MRNDVEGEMVGVCLCTHTCDHMQVNTAIAKLVWLKHLYLKYSPVRVFILLHVLMNLNIHPTI